MDVDRALKDLLQLCADTQDGFWEAATNARAHRLPSLFQDFAVQWNEFSDKVFPILLALDHTSPDARWKANPERVWMNPVRDNSHMDDLAICMQCLVGLELAETRLREAVVTGFSLVSELIARQLNASREQAAAIRSYISKNEKD